MIAVASGASGPSIVRCQGTTNAGKPCSRRATCGEFCKSHLDTTECAICYEKLNQGSGVLETCCGHRFHVKCAAKWANESETCPICRTAFNSGTLQRLLPDVVSRVCHAVFSMSGMQRLYMLDMVDTIAEMMKNEADDEVFVPPPPPDLYSYIEIDDEDVPDDDDADSDYMM